MTEIYMESAHDNMERYSVLLIGNYAPDNQQSMRRYAELLCSELAAQGQKVELITPPIFFGKLGAKAYGIGKWIGYLDKYLVFPFVIKRKIRKYKQPLVVHICDHSNAIYTKYLQDTPHLVTCHDLLAIRSALGEFPQNAVKWSGQKQQAMVLNGLKQSRCITSVSSATCQDVKRLVGSQPSLQYEIPNALSDSFIQEANQPSGVSTIKEHSAEGRYVMHIGSDSWYKNRVAVLRIFSKIAETQPDLKLVIIGPEYSDDALKKYNYEHLREKLLYRKNVDDDALRSIYRHAELLLFPSHIEGFGWPILEAQVCGCAVFTLDQAPMSELNAIPSLRLQQTPDDGSPWEDVAAEQCLEYMNTPEQIKNELKTQIKAFAATFSLKHIIPQYIQIYEAQLESQK